MCRSSLLPESLAGTHCRVRADSSRQHEQGGQNGDGLATGDLLRTVL